MKRNPSVLPWFIRLIVTFKTTWHSYLNQTRILPLGPGVGGLSQCQGVRNKANRNLIRGKIDDGIISFRRNNIL